MIHDSFSFRPALWPSGLRSSGFVTHIQLAAELSLLCCSSFRALTVYLGHLFSSFSTFIFSSLSFPELLPCSSLSMSLAHLYT